MITVKVVMGWELGNLMNYSLGTVSYHTTADGMPNIMMFTKSSKTKQNKIEPQWCTIPILFF